MLLFVESYDIHQGDKFFLALRNSCYFVVARSAVNPTAAEIFRVFRNTTMASIEGLRLLLGECADLRGELVTLHSLHSDSAVMGYFRPANKIAYWNYRKRRNTCRLLLASLPNQAEDDIAAAGINEA